MLLIVLEVIFVLVCLFLILVILLQSGKGGDVAAAFGGSGSQTAFGPRGAQKPLEKATVVAAMLFMLLALIFSLPGIGTQSVVDEGASPQPSPASKPATAPAASPATSPAAAASPAASPTAAASPVASPAASPSK
ncbi:MAG TPA: preprotein translocase subunit SecG [Blastocatellia bacterium]|nr:preprotein translocase subunit SecG [Blastocatellia bacterium]